MTKRRAIVIFHTDMDGNSPEAVQMALDMAQGMAAIGQSMIPSMVDELKANGEIIDEGDAQRLAMGFEVKVMKVDV